MTTEETHINGQWTTDDKKKLVTVVIPLIEIQKAYGRVLDMKLLLRAWQSLLEAKYTVDQVIYALGVYALEKDDFPSPANINKILSPAKPEITQAQFVEAQKSQERNNFPRYSAEAYLIKDYHKQTANKQETYDVECDKVKQLLSNSVKRIGN